MHSQGDSGEGSGNPHDYSCLENSMNRGPWWLKSMGSQKRARHDWVTNTKGDSAALVQSIVLWEILPYELKINHWSVWVSPRLKNTVSGNNLPILFHPIPHPEEYNIQITLRVGLSCWVCKFIVSTYILGEFCIS